MPAPELGTKQICPTCQAKFYDLNRRPAHCPKCASDFDPDEAVRTRRVRARAAPPDYEAEAEDKVVVKEAEDEEAEEEATPEIDQAAAAEPLETDEDTDEPVAAEGADLGVDFEEEEEAAETDDAAVPFLEDEDEDIEDDIVVEDPDES